MKNEISACSKYPNFFPVCYQRESGSPIYLATLFIFTCTWNKNTPWILIIILLKMCTQVCPYQGELSSKHPSLKFQDSIYFISAPVHCQNCGFPYLWHTLLASILQHFNSRSFLLLLYIRSGYPLSHAQFICAASGPWRYFINCLSLQSQVAKWRSLFNF